MRVISESVLLRDETKNITGKMAAINTPQNKRIFLYGTLFLGGIMAGVVGIASIVPPRIPYIFAQCKPFECRKRDNFDAGYGEGRMSYSSFQRNTQFMPKNIQIIDRSWCRMIKIRGIVMVFMRVRSVQSFQICVGIHQFPPPIER